MKDFMARIFSSRVRCLEREVSRLAGDLKAIGEDDFDSLSVAQMTFTPHDGLRATFEGANIGKIIAAFGFNTLKAADAKNYVEFQVRHPKEVGAILITVQRVRGETPASKAARLELEIDKMNREVTCAEYTDRWS